MADRALAGRTLVQLRRERGASPATAFLESEGVELVAALDASDERFGLVLLNSREGHSRSAEPYAGGELDFVGLTCAQAGIALHNAKLAKEAADAERSEATGRLAVTLIHDVGKDLGWIRMLLTP